MTPASPYEIKPDMDYVQITQKKTPGRTWSLYIVRDGARTQESLISLIYSTTNIYIARCKIDFKPVKWVFSPVQDSCIFNWSALSRQLFPRLRRCMTRINHYNSCICVSSVCNTVSPSPVSGSKRDFPC